MSTTATNASFPSGDPWDEVGHLTPQWRAFFLALFNRSGGSGIPTDITGLQKQVTAQNVAINTAVPVQPRPVLIDEGVVPVQRPAAPDFSQGMVYQPPGAYLTPISLSGYDTIAAAVARYASPPAIGNTMPAAGTFTALKGNSNAKLTYQNGSAQSITNTLATVSGWTSVFDANSNFVAATGIFTAPATGFYKISGQLMLNESSPLAGDQFAVQVVANSVVIAKAFAFVNTTTLPLLACPFSALVSLTSGQTAVIQASNSRTQTLNSTAVASWVSIEQIP